MKSEISILLINPWIYDFAAYNLWAAPLGLLYVAAIMKRAGAHLRYIDCLTSEKRQNPHQKANGCSKYIRTIIEKPPALSFVRRHYAVHGISEEEFIEQLTAYTRPDVVFISSLMTYWYPGVFRVIQLIRKIYGDEVIIAVGGIYAQLCTAHATAFSGADIVYTGDRVTDLFHDIEIRTGKKLNSSFHLENFAYFPFPLHELNKRHNFISVLTQRGCPYRCSYCASPLLYPSFTARSVKSVIDELYTYTRLCHTQNVALYDDALLVHAEVHSIPILTRLIENRQHLSIYLPNGVHARFLTQQVAQLFRQAGVKQIRIGLETSDEILQKRTGGKTTNREYCNAVKFLREAGFNKRDIGTYVLAGLPNQEYTAVENTLKFVASAGADPYLALFSPIPGTPIFRAAQKYSTLDIQNEPLFQNNTVYFLSQKNFSETIVQHLKNIAQELRSSTR